MLLNYLDVTALESIPWYALEFSNSSTIEGTIHRVVRAIPKIFKTSPCQLFVPLMRRDLDVFELSNAEFCFVRSDDRRALLRLRQTTGVLGLVTSDGEDQRSTKTINIPCAYVADQIAAAEAAFRGRSDGVKLNSFVRILNGHHKNYCGVVVELTDAAATVEVKLRSKTLTIITPLLNLLNMDSVPVERRVYFFGPLLESVPTDLLTVETVAEETFEEETAYEADSRHKHWKRATTVSHVLRAIIDSGEVDQEEIIRQLIVAIKNKTVQKLPKNSFIIFNIVKFALMKKYPGSKKWNQFASVNKIDLKLLDGLLRDSGIVLPMHTPVAEKSFHRKPRTKKH